MENKISFAGILDREDLWFTEVNGEQYIHTDEVTKCELHANEVIKGLWSELAQYKQREIKLEAIVGGMYECFQKLDEQFPIHTEIGHIASGIMDGLFNQAEIRTDITDLIEIKVEFE